MDRDVLDPLNRCKDNGQFESYDVDGWLRYVCREQVNVDVS